MSLLNLKGCDGEALGDHEWNMVAFTTVLGLLMLLPMDMVWLNFVTTWFSEATVVSGHEVQAAQVENPQVTESSGSMLVDAAGY